MCFEFVKYLLNVPALVIQGRQLQCGCRYTIKPCGHQTVAWLTLRQPRHRVFDHPNGNGLRQRGVVWSRDASARGASFWGMDFAEIRTVGQQLTHGQLAVVGTAP